jgi:hypothetical protein
MAADDSVPTLSDAPKDRDLKTPSNCERVRYRTKIHSIPLDYTVQLGNGRPQRFTVELPGDIDVLLTDLTRSPDMRRALGHGKAICGKPSEFPAPVHKLLAAETQTEPPECCYYYKGKWICW